MDCTICVYMGCFMVETIINESKLIEEKLIVIRRELHKFPEIGGSLPQYPCNSLPKIEDDFGEYCKSFQSTV